MPDREILRLLAENLRALIRLAEEAAEPADPDASLPTMQRNILDALRSAARPLESRALARAAGYAYGSRFRQAVADLRAAGRIRQVDGAYSLSPPPGTE